MRTTTGFCSALVASLCLGGCALQDLADQAGDHSDPSLEDRFGPDGDDGTEPWRDENNQESYGPNGECYDCAWDQPQKLALDLSSAVGLAIISSSDSQSHGPSLRGMSLGLDAPQAPSSEAWLAFAQTSSLHTGALLPGQEGVLQDGEGSAGGDGSVPDAQEPAAPGDEGDPTMAGEEQEASLYALNEDGTMQPALVPLQGEEPPPEEGASEPGTSGDSGSGTTPPDESGSEDTSGVGEGGDDPAGEPLTTEEREAAEGEGDGQNTAPDYRPPPPPLPRVTALGMSPDGSVYVLFEHAFLYREVDPSDEQADPWSPDSPYTCQLFRAASDYDPSQAGSGSASELECVTNQHQIPTWRSDRVMQFDREGRLYFPAMFYNNGAGGQEVFYVFDPTTWELREKVNANICWRDVEVTPRGSVFYTGSSNSNGDCSGTSFFRYVSTDNQLTEIARDWWDFKYLAEQDPANSDSERIIFYGPDPRETTSDPWSSACLYRYDPAVTEPEARVTALTQCAGGGYEYVYGGQQSDTYNYTPEQRAGFAERCAAEGMVFLDGNGVSELAQMSDGTIFVAGEFNRKLAGSTVCDLQVTVSHCVVEEAPVVGIADEGACTSAGGEWHQFTPSSCSDPQYDNQIDCQDSAEVWTWGDEGSHWYSQVSGDACLGNLEGWNVGWMECRAVGGAGYYGDFTDRISGLAFLSGSGEESTLSLLSDPSEEVESFWTIEGEAGPEFYYSVYRAGSYSLQRALIQEGEVVRHTILNNYEVYNVSRDPSHAGRILFDGLSFADNEYQFGSVDPNLSTPEEIQASVDTVSGVTGRVETLVILPSF